jgi:hypothetical protein
MSDKRKVPLHFAAQIEERFSEPAHRRWHAQFCFYPHGWFRGQGNTPALALSAAWRAFRRELDPEQRWWTIVQGAGPPVRF